MISITSNFQYLNDAGTWAVKKTAESIRTNRYLYLFPVAISAVTGYKSLQHYGTALMGTDSWAYRKKNFLEGYRETEYPLSKRINLIFKSIFGSIQLKDRAWEFCYGSGYLAASLGTLYALHALLEKQSQTTLKFDSHFDEASKELLPDTHRKYIHDKAIDFLSEKRVTEDGHSFEMIDLYVKTILNPAVPLLNKNTEVVVHFADQAILPASTPFEEAIAKPFYAFLHTVTGGSYGAPYSTYSTEYLTTEQLTQAYEKTRQILIDQEPIDWQGHAQNATKGLCDWTWGWLTSVESDCSNFASLLGEGQTSQLSKRLEVLERLYKALMQRAILQGRGDCSTPGGAEQICEEYCKTHVSSILSNIKSYFTTMQERGKEFVNQVKLAEVFPLSPSETNVEKVDQFTIAINAMGEKSEEHVDILRKAASRFFGLAENFSKKDFKQAYRNYMRTHHPDKLGTKLGDQLTVLSGIFKGIFDGKANDLLYESQASSAVTSGGFPSPWKVILDLGSWSFEWLKTSPPDLEF